MAFDLEDAKDSARHSATKLPKSSRWLHRPKDYPYHPIWKYPLWLAWAMSALTSRETSFEKLDPRWLEDQLGVRGANDHWIN